MIYKSYADICREVSDWSSQLPEFAGICGIPRAGSFIAYLLSAHRNCHLIAWNDLLHKNETWKQSLRRNCAGVDGTILVVDDTIAAGNQIRNVKEQLKNLPYHIKYGAYFAMSKSIADVDYYYKNVGDEDHLFEFNVFHHWATQAIATDLDGVISEDWNYLYETGDLTEKYKNHLENGRCLIKPTFTLGAIVTGRLECHRETTERWLAKNGIKYRQLVMYPATSPEGRGNVGAWKGELYRQSNAYLFVESCPNQSNLIRRISNRPVLDWTSQICSK